MRLHNNMMSLNVFKNYQNNLVDNAAALKRVSSGSKIMSAKDNPGKLGQSENFKLQLRGLQAAKKNVQDGVSMMQTADGGLSGMSESLIRMRELTVKAGNDTLSLDDKKVIQNEIEQLKEGINDLATNTEFNGVKLLGDEGVTNNENPSSHSMAAGINSGDDIFIPSFNLNCSVLTDKNGNKLSDVDVVNEDTDKALETIDVAMQTVSDIRSKYGALENRFENLGAMHESNSLMLERADSNITSADVAKEMIEFSRTNILIEASNYMMAQTNELPNEALRAIERI
ncbi:flagellin [uncultured Clostridium sp.]|uniref:flagellin n=1 Tax=uncultured Clostridium sp. TaxID=59620 RepID=UPI00262AF2A5|nr:flagellin [uncultured Clostridium sp.]